MFGWLKGILVAGVLYGLINGGLYLYWHSAHGKEHKQYETLGKWLKEKKTELDDIEVQAESVSTQEEYDNLESQFNELKDEYNEKVDEYNDVVETLNDEFYLIPMPKGKHI